MPAAFLQDRSIVAVDGPEARSFLQGLVTCDMNKVSPHQAAFGALLTPQGKILFDFLVIEQEGRFLFDVARDRFVDFAKRLGFYKLRAKASVNPEPALAVVAFWGADAPPPEGLAVYDDPRNAALGQRAIMTVDRAQAYAHQEGAYEAHRIACATPRGGVDFLYGDAFPQEANMDLLHGVAFDKGCYVGQEVVSRMHHRATARKRIVAVAVAGKAPPPGAEIRAGDAVIGALGAVAGGRGLAMVRLDRLADAGDAPLEAGEARLTAIL
ncbi:MAG: folate-binding protein YgfZ [Hyphomicrobiales bacterium]|nr:folate-binding protein YgfZ [Hyphomicrobiales bacterium]